MRACREQQENNAWTNQQKQRAQHDVIYDNGAAQKQLKQNQYQVGKADIYSCCRHTYKIYALHQRLEYLNQTSFLRKDLKIGAVIGNAVQKGRLNNVSLSHQKNDRRTAGYSEKEVIEGSNTL